jgi:hypothetical protein
MNVLPPTGKDIAELLLLCAPKNSLTELDLSETTFDEFASFFDQFPIYVRTQITALALYYANRSYVKFNKSYSLVSKLYIAPEVILSLIDLTRSEEFSETESIFSEIAKEKRSAQARKGANAKHDKPNGSREKAGNIRAIWASGKYSSRDICAEQEYAALGYGSFKAARKALINTPEPT